MGIAILGEPDYYPKWGFERGEKYQICCEYGYIDPLMVYPLNDGFENVHGKLVESHVFEEVEDEAEIAKMNKEFPYHKPLKLECQWLHVEKLGQI